MKTYPIKLDKQRQLRFDAKTIRNLDQELAQETGHRFAYYMQQMAPNQFARGAADVPFDVLVVVLRHGLVHEEPRLTDDAVCAMIDRAQVPEGDLWSAVIDAYTDARGMQVKPIDLEEESAEGPPAPRQVKASGT